MAEDDKIERLLNLVALLSNARRPVTAAQIREKLRIDPDKGDEAFHRMFERDKEAIKHRLGFDVVTEEVDAWGGEVGYRIVHEADRLADPGLTADEIAALSLAAQVGRSDDGALGLLKLAGADDPGAGAAGWLLPRLSLEGPMAVLMDAIARRKRVRFHYRTASGEEATEREVEPHGLYHRGAWYLQGFDRAREGVRAFKLTRVQGKITIEPGLDADFEPPSDVSFDVMQGPWDADASIEARVAFAPEVAWWVQRRTGAARAVERDDGWTELAIPAGDLDAFAAWVAGFGAHAEALAPDELRSAVAAHLRAVLEA